MFDPHQTGDSSLEKFLITMTNRLGILPAMAVVDRAAGLDMM